MRYLQPLAQAAGFAYGLARELRLPLLFLAGYLCAQLVAR